MDTLMNKKQIIQLIKKMAGDVIDLNDPNSAEASPSGGKDPGIVKMQEGLINVAKLITDQFQQKSTNAAVGSVSFSDFIAQNYLKKSTSAPGATEYETNAPRKMINIMETVTGIGGSGYDFAADGKWGPKTNKSLNNIKSFASAMLKLAEDFKMQLESYSVAQLAGFTVPVKDTDWTQQQKSQYAPILTEHIDLIARMFSEIKDKILNNSEHKEYIEGTKPLISYKKTEQLPDYELEKIKTLAKENAPISLGVPQPGVPNSILPGQINVKDLLSKSSFDAWLNSTGAEKFKQYKVKKPEIFNAIRRSLKFLRDPGKTLSLSTDTGDKELANVKTEIAINNVSPKSASFIYENKQLINYLIKCAQDGLSTLKMPEMATLPSSEPSAPDLSLKGNTTTILKLLDKLESDQVEGQPIISSDDAAGADLTSIDLQNLGALVQFTITKKIMVDYTRIAYNVQEKPSDTDYKLISLETNPYFAQSGYHGESFYINTDLLIKYLQSLLAVAHQKNITTMDVQLKHLIDQAQKYLKIKVEPYVPPGASPGAPGTTPGKTPGTPGAVPGAPGALGTPGSSAQDAATLLDNLIGLMPLSEADINFRRITDFFEAYEAYLDAGNLKDKPAILSSINEGKRLIENLSSKFSGGILYLNKAPNEIYTLIRSNLNNYVGNIAGFIEKLNGLITKTEETISRLQYLQGGRHQDIFQKQLNCSILNQRKLEDLKDYVSETLKSTRAK
jgi:hypothetical protein